MSTILLVGLDSFRFSCQLLISCGHLDFQLEVDLKLGSGLGLVGGGASLCACGIGRSLGEVIESGCVCNVEVIILSFLSTLIGLD